MVKEKSQDVALMTIDIGKAWSLKKYIQNSCKTANYIPRFML